MTTVLRPYQLQAVSEIRDWARRHPGNGAVLQMPTGAGKTAVFCELLKAAHKKGGYALMAVRGKQLVHQAAERLAREGVPYGIFQGDRSTRTAEKILVCSIDTLYRRKIAPHANLIVLDECFTPDMEVLTHRGFVRFDQLDGKELVAQFDQTTQGISFCEPVRYIKKHVENYNIITWRSPKKIDVSMTEGHEVLAVWSDGSVRKTKAKDFKFGDKHFYKAGRSTAHDSPLTPREKLCLAFQADGCDQSAGRMHFTFTRQRKIDAFFSLMQEGGFDFHEIKATARKNDRGIRRRFSVGCYVKKTKFLDEVFDLTRISWTKARSIVEYMVHWDGSRISDSLYYYSSVEKRNRDFIQACAVLAGYATNGITQKDGRKNTHRDIHRLFIRLDTDRASAQSIKKTVSKYTGLVYCVSVPKGNIIVRRNGKPLIIGNCHLTLSDSYKWFLAQYPKAFKLGVSATPHHKDGMRHIGDKLIYPASFADLVSQGYLVGGRYFVPYIPDLTGVEKSGGDFNTGKLGAKSIADEHLTANAAMVWDRHLRGVPTLLYAVSVEHAGVLARALSAKGARVATVTADTPDDERKRVIDDLSAGRLDVLASVGVLTTGVDIPPLRAILCCRPTDSYNLWIQILGRGTRPFKGKKHFLCYDLSGNLLKHGPIEAELIADIDGFPPVPKTALKMCDSCFAIFPAAEVEDGCCPECEADLPKRIRTAGGKRIHGLGDDKEMVEKIVEPWEMRLPTLLARAREKGLKKGWVYHMIRGEFGEEVAAKAWPRIRNLKKWDTRRTA